MLRLSSRPSGEILNIGGTGSLPLVEMTNQLLPSLIEMLEVVIAFV